MKRLEYKEILKEKLTNSIIKSINKIKKELNNDSVISYFLLCESGFVSIGLAWCGEKELETIKNTTDYSNEINMENWKHINEDWELFSEVNDSIGEFYENYYEESFEDVDFNSISDEEYDKFPIDFFVEAISEVINSLKERKIFEDSIFHENILLGINFFDAESDQIDQMERVSEKVNSVKNHNKIKTYCTYYKTENMTLKEISKKLDLIN